MAKQKKNSVADKLQEQPAVVETKEETIEPAVTKEEMENIAVEGVDLSVGEPSITSHAETGKLFVSAREAYKYFPLESFFVTGLLQKTLLGMKLLLMKKQQTAHQY